MPKVAQVFGTHTIARASELREQLARNDLDEIGGMCYFSRPRQLYYASDAGAALPGHDESGLRKETEASGADAITAYEQAPDEEKSFGDEAGSRTDLAIVRIRSGNLEGAREAVQPVLDLPVTLRINGQCPGRPPRRHDTSRGHAPRPRHPGRNRSLLPDPAAALLPECPTS